MSQTQRYTPTVEEAEGMLKALTSGHECGDPCTGTVQCGPDLIQLRCPYKVLDLSRESDRRTVATVYVNEALAAMGAS